MLFTRLGNIGGAAVVGQNQLMANAMMVIEWNLELIGESIDDSSANAKPRKRARARKIGNFPNLWPIGGIFTHFVVDETKNSLSHTAALGMPFIVLVVEA